MSTQHTPRWERRGEYGLEIWEYQEPEPEVEGDEPDEDDGSGWLSVCTVHQPGEGNARLIAAAPDLLDALEVAWTEADWSAVDGDTMNKVADAIARAREGS